MLREIRDESREIGVFDGTDRTIFDDDRECHTLRDMEELTDMLWDDDLPLEADGHRTVELYISARSSLSELCIDIGDEVWKG